STVATRISTLVLRCHRLTRAGLKLSLIVRSSRQEKIALIWRWRRSTAKMKRDGARFAVATLLAMALIGASLGKRVASPDETHGTAGRVTVGVWGGPDVEMEVTQHGAT